MTKRWAATALLVLASIAAQAAAADAGSVSAAIVGAGAFVLAALKRAWDVNRPWWTPGGQSNGPSPLVAQPQMAARNAELLALGYGWGALSLLAVYLLTALHWQHGWQYGSGKALIAALLVRGATWLRAAEWTPFSYKMLTGATLVHGAAAAGGLAWLIASGKMLPVKGDWAANVVFVSGAVLIAGVSLMGLRTARVLEAEVGKGDSGRP